MPSVNSRYASILFDFFNQNIMIFRGNFLFLQYFTVFCTCSARTDTATFPVCSARTDTATGDRTVAVGVPICETHVCGESLQQDVVDGLRE